MPIVIPRGVKRDRYRMAVHELGHITAWERVGKVSRVGYSWWDGGGYVSMEWPSDMSDADGRMYMVGMWSGHVADELWCQETGDRHDHDTCSHDMACVKRSRRLNKVARKWSDRDLQAEARRICRSNWATMLHRAEKLARRGRL